MTKVVLFYKFSVTYWHCRCEMKTSSKLIKLTRDPEVDSTQKQDMT